MTFDNLGGIRPKCMSCDNKGPLLYVIGPLLYVIGPLPYVIGPLLYVI